MCINRTLKICLQIIESLRFVKINKHLNFCNNYFTNGIQTLTVNNVRKNTRILLVLIFIADM